LAIQDFNDPLVIQWNTDDAGNKISVQITNEEHKVVKNKILLNQIPDLFYKVQISGLFEIKSNQQITATNQFKVDYTTGLVTFHSSKEAQTITVTQYYGRGIIYYSSERIYTQLDNAGNVKETLADIFDKSKIVYKTPIATYADIATTYPSPLIGDGVQVEDTGRFYRWDGSAWKYFQILHPTQLAQILTDMGDISFLETDDKSNLVNAVNENSNKIGNLSELTTTEKTNLVGAVSEVKNQVVADKADNAISPEDYTGNAVEKISAAIQDAITQKRAVKFSKWYDITGLGTIVITKPGNVGVSRTLLYLIGDGGGIQKDDAGYIFECTTYSNAGDIVSTNMHYRGVVGAGMCVWNGNKVIRLTSHCDSYVDCDGVAWAIEAGRYFQTLRFNKCTITGGAGWAFACEHLYDVVISECIIENRESFFCNDFTNKNPAWDTVDNVVLRIVDNLIEGITGSCIKLGACYATKITGNYTEAVEGIVIDCSHSLNNIPHRGLEITDNGLQRSDAQILAKTPCIKWGNISEGGCISYGNTTRGVLHSIDTSNTNKLMSLGDHANNKRYFDNKRIGVNIHDIVKSSQQVTNVLFDPDFPVPSFWAGENGVNTAVNNVLISTGNGTNARVRTNHTYAVGANPASRKIYVQSKFKVTNANCLDVNYELRSTIAGSKSVTILAQGGIVQNTVYTVSNIVTIPADWDTTNIVLYIYHHYADAATSNGKVMEIYPTIMVDLTTDYGAGNEPTKDYMYQLITNQLGGFFGDSVYIPKMAENVKNNWKDWIVTETWSTATPASINRIARYTTIGNTCFFNYYAASADGNGATQLTITPPVTPKDNNSVITFTAQQQVDTTWTNPLAYLDDDAGGITFRAFAVATDAKSVTVIVSGQYEI
jgi:hypothetical protein